jgi:hypothetical protein
MNRMMMYSLTQRELFDTTLIEKSLIDIKSKGFNTIFLEWRNVSCNFLHPRLQNALKKCNDLAREMGLKVTIHANPLHVNGNNIKDDMPEVFTDPIEPTILKLANGEFTVITRGEKLHCNIEKCYLVENESEFFLSKCIDITDKIKETSSIFQGGGCKMTRVRTLAELKTTYAVEGHTSGDIIAIIRYSYTYSGQDLSHPLKRKCNSDILETFGDFETDGFFWDEPHFGFAFCTNNGRQISENLYNLFNERFSYSLKDNLISLWYDVKGINSGSVRLNYAEILESALAEDEMDFYSKGLKQLEEKGIKGNISCHRTMHEETSDDFYIGCVDYFRHNKATTGGFTDSVYEREDSMLAMFQLANSLAADNEYKTAYNMSWGFNPTLEQNDYYLSLMSAMNIAWIGHAYHCSVMFGPGYPNHPIWDRMQIDLQEHKTSLELLEDATRINDVAVLYTWRALASFPDNYIHTHRRNLLFLSKTLTLDNKQHQFISYEILEDAEIKNGEIQTTVGNFKKLIIPWCDFISKKALEKVEECKSQGVSVVIFGPPANSFVDGENASNEFARLCGINPIDVKNAKTTTIGETIEINQNQFDLNPQEIQENFESNSEDTYPENFKYYVLSPIDTSSEIAKINGSCVGIKSGSVEYYGAELAFYKNAVEHIFKNYQSIKALDNLILFEYTTKKGKALSGVSRWNKPLTGNFEWQNKTISLDDCNFFIIRLDDESEPKVFSNGKATCKN